MSTKNYEINAGLEKYVSGVSYNGVKNYLIKPSLFENYTAKMCNPVSVAPAGSSRCDITLSPDDEFNINEVYFQFTVNNSDGALTATVFNPFLFLSEFKVLINQQQVIYLDSQEKIFQAQSWYWRQFTNPELKINLLKILPSQTTPLSGETIGTSSSTTFSLPLSILCPWMRNISRSDGVSVLSFEMRFAPNLNTIIGIGRFLKSSSTSNVYGALTFTDLQMRLAVTKHSDGQLRNLPACVMPIQCSEDKIYSLSWNATTASQRIQLSTDFSHHNSCFAMSFYIIDGTSKITAWNDADAGCVYSELTNIGVEVKYKSRTIVKLSDATGQYGLTARRQYNHYIHKRRYNKEPNVAIYDASDNSCNYFYPQTWIDLTCVDNSEGIENNNIISGIANGSSDIEIILTNCIGAFSTSCSLYVCLHYWELGILNPKTGLLTIKK